MWFLSLSTVFTVSFFFNKLIPAALSCHTCFAILYDLHSLNVKINWNKGQFLVISKPGRLEACSCNRNNEVNLIGQPTDQLTD